MQKSYAWLAWGLFLTVTTVALLEWGSSLGWRLDYVTLYSLFPLLGLLAWSIMWTHYAYGAVLVIDEKAKKSLTYKKITQWLVLALILLHPGLLAYAQWQNLDSLPPGSWYGFVGESAKVFITIGLVAMLTFLAYDVLERMRSNQAIKRSWFWVSLSQALAMVLIFVHALGLGQHLQGGWFLFYWVVLGALLIPCFGLVLRHDWTLGSKR